MKFAVLLFVVGCTAQVAGDPGLSRPCPIDKTALGESLAVSSKILGETRTVNVYLPPDYKKSPDRYPVLYMPDGGMAEDFPHIAGDVDVSIRNGVIRPVIVVGVQNIDRKKDMLRDSAKFRAFFTAELRPEIERRYRTTQERALVGESLAGLFVVEAFLRDPASYDHYIAADPSVWWDNRSLVGDASELLAVAPPGVRSLYIANSDEGDAEGTELLVRAMAAFGLSDELELESMPAEHHATIFPTASLHGIRRAFAP